MPCAWPGREKVASRAPWSSLWIACLRHRRRFAAWGGVLFALSMTWGILLRTAQPDYLRVFLPQLLIGGAAAGLTIGNLLAAGTEHIPEGSSGAGNGILNTTRQAGSAIGVAVVVTALSLQHRSSAGFKLAWASAAAAGLVTTILALVVRGRDTSAEGFRPEVNAGE